MTRPTPMKGRLIQKIQRCFHESASEGLETERVDVHPRNILGKRPAYYRAVDAPNSPHHTNKPQPLPSQSQWYKIGNNDLGEGNDTTATNTLQRSAHEQDCEVICDSSHDSTNGEEGQGYKYQWLAAKNM